MRVLERLGPVVIRAAIRYLPPRGRSSVLAHRWTAKHPPSGRIFASRERSGLVLQCDLRDELSRSVYYLGRTGTAEEAWLERWLRPGDTYVDVGAHIGYFVSRAATAVRPGGRIVAFEPNPQTFEKLERAVGASRDPRVDIRLHQRATGDRPGSAVLNRPLGRHEHQTSRASLVAGDEFEPGDTVAVVRLDDGLADVARLRLLKIDVEGFEAAVLRGARQVLRRCDAVLIEINPTALHRAGSEPGEVIALLEQQQLWPHRVDADGKLVRTNRVQVATEFEDLVFVRQP